MNQPYDNAKDAVEFWQPVAEIFGITLEYDAAEDSIHPGDYMVQMSGLWYGLEEFTRDMVARCENNLDEKHAHTKRDYTGSYVVVLDPNDEDAHPVSTHLGPHDMNLCELKRAAVLAVSGEGGG